MDDLISVIVPVYNVEKYLSQCIESVIHQTYSNLEVAGMIDGYTKLSDDKIVEIIAKEAKKRLIYYLLFKNVF